MLDMAQRESTEITGEKEYWTEVKKKWNGFWGDNFQHNLYHKHFQSNKTEKSHERP